MLKKLLFTISILFFVSFSNIANAQTQEEKKEITNTHNINKLKELEKYFSARYKENKSEAYKFAKSRGIRTSYISKDGSFVELQGILPDGTLLYYTTFNDDAARSTRTDHLNIGGSLGLNLDGQNMTAHVWDGGLARSTHQEYDGPGGNDRFSIGDGTSTLNYHAAHVTGTIIASGVQPAAKGMAPQAQAIGYDWNSDLSEATAAANNGMLISNHSYGYITSQVPDYFFGGYILESRSWDDLLYNAPYYLMVVAAGNDGNNDTDNGSPLNGNAAYDKLTGHSVSKNNLVVANAQDATVDVAGNLISVFIRSSSSEGPTDDFRIKPDITGNGTGLYSTYESSDTAYNSITGTSMASPNVAGSLLLLQQHANNLNGSFMRAATLKGLALHTADDIGPTGPDAIHGWGLLNAKRAAQTISEDGNISLIQELTLSQGQTYSIDVQANEMEDLMASISWTDPAGTATTILNNTTPSLVNDLDIKITKNTDQWFPWRLTGVDTNANDSDNLVDPFERLEVTNPTGTYTVTVTHKGTLTNSSQDYTLIITGMQVDCTSANIPSNIQAFAVKGTTATINWNPSAGEIYDLRYRESGTITWIDISDLVVASTTLTGLTALTEYEVQVRSKCPGGTPTAYSDSIFFTTTELVYCDSFGTTQQDEYIGNLQFSTINNTSADESGGYSDFTNISTPVIIGQSYTISITPIWTATLFNEGYAVWIDYNQNGDFSDTGELVFSQSPTQVTPVTGTIIIPNNALEGSTRMRVSMKWNGIPGPCENFQYGEVEDYTVNIYRGYLYNDNSWLPNHPVTGAIPSTISDNITVINGTALLSEAIFGNNLTVETGANLELLPSSTSTSTVLELNGDIVNEGQINFKSDNNGSAQLDTFTGTVSGSGEVTIERYIPGKRAFRLLASPVTTTDFIYENWQESGSTPTIPDGLGTHITGGDASLGFDQNGSGNPSMFTFDNSNSNGTPAQTDDWIPLSNTNATKLRAGEAYLTMVRGDRTIDLSNGLSTPTITTLRAKGDLFTGTLSYSVGNSTSYLSLNDVDDFYNLIANPYQAVVDFDAVSKTGLTGYIYVWDAVIDGANGRGGYVTIDLPSAGVAPPPASSSQASHYLAPGMSFFVQNDSDAGTTSSITFQETDKRTNETEIGIFSNYSNFYINSRLYSTSAYLNGESESDAIGLRFSDDFTTPGDSEDATKLFNPGENYAIINNGLRSIDKQQIPTIGYQIDLTILNYQETNYSLTFMMENKPAGLDVFIIDNYLNTQTELAASFVYDFSVDANIPQSVAEDRFSLVFDTTTLNVDENTFGEGFRLYPNPVNNGQFSIRTPNLSGEVTVELLNMLGQKVMSKNLTIEGNEVNVNAGQLSDGVYIVKLVKDNKTFVTKLIVE